MSAPIEVQMVEEQWFETAMQMVEDKNWHDLKAILDRVSDNTAEAIRESLSAADMNSLMSV